MKLTVSLLLVVAIQGLYINLAKRSPTRTAGGILNKGYRQIRTSLDQSKTNQGLRGNKNDVTTVEIVASDNKPTQFQLSAFDLCLCGAFATVFGDFVMHPIDTIKITQQTAASATSIFATFSAILSSKGIFGLYQGIVPYLVGDGLSGAVKFATFEITRRISESKLPERQHGLARFLCAAFAMLVCSFILVPGEVLKTRLQAGSVASLSMAVASILQTDGWRGFFAGYYATLVRDIPYTMLELGIYENLKLLFQKWRKPNNTRGVENANDELFAAAITGAIAAFLTTPLDLVKTKLMMQSGSVVAYSGVVDVLQQLYADGGVSALFVGAIARVTWLVPFTTIYLGVYERCKRLILVWKQNKRV